MAPRSSSSAAMRSILRELQRRRTSPLAPKRPAANKPSAPPSGGASACGAETLRPGTAVLARTRTATLRTGQCLVLWLSAVVVSANEEGYEVVYKGDWPRGNPVATVQVARDHVKLTKSPTTTPPCQPPSSAASSCASITTTTTTVAAAPKKETMQPTPRPTTAGKSVRLIRKL